MNEPRRSVMCLLYGQPGIGASTLAASVGRPFAIDTCDGTRRVPMSVRPRRALMHWWDDVLDLMGDADSFVDCDTVIVDSCDGMMRLIDEYLATTEPRTVSMGVLTVRGWQRRASLLSAFLRALMSLDRDIVLVAHEREERAGELRVRRPDLLGGRAAEDVVSFCDIVGYMEAVGAERTVTFSPRDSFYAKNGAGIDERIVLPNVDDDPAFLAGIFDRVAAARAADVASREAYDAAVSEAVALIAGIETPDDATSAAERIERIEEIWDSRSRGRRLLASRARELAFVRDGADGPFRYAVPTR